MEGRRPQHDHMSFETDRIVVDLIAGNTAPSKTEFSAFSNLFVINSEYGVEGTRQSVKPSFQNLASTLRDQAIDEAKLAMYTYENGSNVVGHYINDAIRNVGFYDDTWVLVDEAAKHTGIPVSDLTSAALDLYKSDKEYDPLVPNKVAAVSMLESIALKQADLPDSRVKENRVVTVGAAVINMLTAENLDNRMDLDITPRRAALENALLKMGRSFDSGRDRDVVASGLRAQCDLYGAQITYDTIRRAIEKFQDTGSARVS